MTEAGVKRAARNRWVWLIAILAALAACVLSLVAYRAMSTPGPLPFNRADWDAALADWQDTTRHRMADTLLQSGQLIGKSRDDVIDLLGAPTPTGHFSDWDLIYILGAERGYISIDSEWLLIRLDSGGKVSEAALTTD